MNCPNCQQSMIETIRVCQACEAKYSNSELVELLQLKFLLAETADWPNLDQQRAGYAQRLQALQMRLAAETQIEDQIPVEEPAAETVPRPQAKATSAAAQPKPAAVDQWFFSETTIKFALYAGGFLLVLAGLIFIGASWANLPAAAKLLVTLSVTGLMYGGGFALFRHSKLRPGGLALLGVASGFVPLNFVVLHIYLLDGRGVDPQLTWLIGSILCLLLYLATLMWTRSHLFTYLSALAALSGLTAALFLLGSPLSGFVLAYALVPVPLLIVAFGSRSMPTAGYLTWPCSIISALMLVLVIPFLIWVALDSPETLFVTVMFLVIAVLYGATAVLTRWKFLLLPALFSLDLIILSGNRLIDDLALTPVTVTFSAVGILLLIVAAGLSLANLARWSWPFYLFACANLAGSYLAGLFLDQPWPIIFSLVFGLAAFSVTWVERTTLGKIKLAPLPTYVGLILLFIGHFYLLDLVSTGQNSDAWPIISASFCTLFVLTSWLFRDEPLKALYGQPLYWTGLGLMVIPAAGAVAVFNEPIGIVTMAIIGATWVLDGLARRRIYQVYMGTGAFIGLIWFGLVWMEVEFGQPYIIPAGLWLLIVAWIERYRRQYEIYVMLSITGLLILLGSAFVQSLLSSNYALLLLFESLVVLIVGLGGRSRSYVLIGLAGLVINGLAQFLPAFGELPRFIQIGLIGTILLGGGLLALFVREQILNVGRSMRLHWQDWGP